MITKRIYGLDILRSIAILTVLYLHARFAFPTVDPDTYNSFVPDGVSIFFVLSGYLIGTILLKVISKPAFTAKDLLIFWQKRWFRTLPAYFVILGALFCYSKIAWGHIPREAWSHLFFIQSFFKADNYFFAESWSLCVEEWFYLVVPFLLYISLKCFSNRKLVMLFWIAFIILIEFIAREFKIRHIVDSEEYRETVRQATIMRMDSIMYGLLASFLAKYYPSQWFTYRNLQFVIGILLLIGVKTLAFLKVELHSFWPDIETLATFLVIPKLLTVTNGKGLFFKFFTFISTISYSLYLVNLTLFKYIEQYVAGGLSFYLFFSFAGAYLLHILVEQPFMRLRNRLFKEEVPAAKIAERPVIYCQAVQKNAVV